MKSGKAKKSGKRGGHPKEGHSRLGKLPSLSRDPLKLLKAAVAGRVRSLLPIREERMAESPFAFFRGAAALMAADLAESPHSGVLCQLCGDAHLANLGAYAGLDGRLVFDINDFDETIRGPFEWDLKRLATSALLAADAAGLSSAEGTEAARAAVRRYCAEMHRLAALPVLEAARIQIHGIDSVAPISAVMQKAERETPQKSLEKLTEEHEGRRRFRNDPPSLRRLSGDEIKEVQRSLDDYRASLLPERSYFLTKFQVMDYAFKVVGVGSVGMRDFCVYLQGNGAGDPLFLQIKEETRSCYARYLPKKSSPRGNQGKRVADGQRAMQLESDPLLGWTEMDGRDYLVRQLKDHKASLDLSCLHAQDLIDYAEVTGALLARGHCRSGDAQEIAAYAGQNDSFSEAILHYASAYRKQTEADWKTFTAAQKKSAGKL